MGIGGRACCGTEGSFELATKPTAQHEGVSIFTDAVVAFILGVVDWDKTGTAGRTALDRLVSPEASEGSPNVRS